MKKKFTYFLLIIIFLNTIALTGCFNNKSEIKPIKNVFKSNTEIKEKQITNENILKQSKRESQQKFKQALNKNVQITEKYNYEQLYFKPNLTQDEKLALFNFYMELRKNEIFTNKNSTPENIVKIYNIITTSQIVIDDNVNISSEQKALIKQFNEVYAKQNLGYIWTTTALQWLKQDRENGVYYESLDSWFNPEIVEETARTFTVKVLYKTEGRWINMTTGQIVKEAIPEYKVKYYSFVFIDNLGWRIYKLIEQ